MVTMQIIRNDAFYPRDEGSIFSETFFPVCRTMRRFVPEVNSTLAFVQVYKIEIRFERKGTVNLT
jgi:hypothetical protein